MKKIKINEIDIFFTKRKKQKNICLKINPKGDIILSAPYFCNQSTALDFVQKNIEWIKKHKNQNTALKKFNHNDSVSILGKTYLINHNPQQKSNIKVDNNTLFVGGEANFIHRRISNFAKKELLSYIDQKANQMARVIQKKPNKISLKNTTSRWGSCSTKKNLNFCWKIAFAPLFVIDYLVAHEVSHLKEMNHSADFWKTVSLFQVEQAKAQIWLRKNGKNLMNIQ